MAEFEDYLIAKLDTIEKGNQNASTSGSESYNQNLGTNYNSLEEKIKKLEYATAQKQDNLNQKLQPTFSSNPENVNYMSASDLQYTFGSTIAEHGIFKDPISGEKFQLVRDENGNQVKKPWLESSGKTRNAYIDNTAEGNMKFGLAASELNADAISKGITPYDARYMDKTKYNPYTYEYKSSDPLNKDLGYNGTPGPRGVTNKDGSLMDVELPKDIADRLEYLIHTNAGQILSRAEGQGKISDSIKKEFGAGRTEYTTPDAPLWNINYDINKAKINEDTVLPKELTITAREKEDIYRQTLNEELAKPYTDQIYSTSRIGNLDDTLQYGLGSKAAKVGDTLADAGLRIAKGLMSGTEEEKNAKINNILSGTVADKYVTDKGDFTGLDKYKEAKEYGYDNRRVQAELKKAGDAFESGNMFDIAKSLASVVVNAGAELLLESSGEMALGAARLPGFIINSATYNNEILENKEKITGEVADTKDRLIAGTGAIIMSALNKVGTDELLGNTTFAKDAIGALSKIGTKDQVKNASMTIGDKLLGATQYLAKSTGENIAKGTGEGLEEVFQDLTQTIAEKLDTKEQNQIFSSDTYKQLFQSFAGGFAGGSTMASISESKDLATQLKDKVTGKAFKKAMEDERDDREKFIFTKGEDWITRPGAPLTKDKIEAQDVPVIADELYKTREQIKTRSPKIVADAIYGEKELKDNKGNTVNPQEGLNNMIDSLRTTYFSDLKVNRDATARLLSQINAIQDPVEKQKELDRYNEGLANEKLSKTNSYVNDYMHSYISMIDRLSDTTKNVSDEKRQEAKDLATNEYIKRIHSEPDEFIKNKLLAKFTNEFVTTLADKLFAKKEEMAKGKATENKSFGSLDEISNGDLYGEKGQEYIDKLKEVKKRIFGSQDPNAPIIDNPIEKEFDEKIKSFESKYNDYQERLKSIINEGKSRNEAVTLLNAKTAEDVASEILDGSGFVTNIQKPTKKSINGHMNVINKNIANIKYTASESAAQGSRINDLLSSVNGLTKFSDTRSKNNDSYDDIANKYSVNMSIDDKIKLAQDLMKRESDFTKISRAIKEGNPTVDEEVRALREKGLPVYRVGLDKLAPVKNKDGSVSDQSTGSRMIKEGQAFISSMNEVKAMLNEKIKLKSESLLAPKLSEKVASSIKKDIEVINEKINEIDESINKQQANINNIDRLMNIVKDPVIAYERSRIISDIKAKAKAQATTPGSESKMQEATKDKNLKNGDPIKLFSKINTEDGKHITLNFNPEGQNSNGPSMPSGIKDGDIVNIIKYGEFKNEDMEYDIVYIEKDGKKYYNQEDGRPYHITRFVNSENGIKPFMTGVDASKRKFDTDNVLDKFIGIAGYEYGKYNDKFDKSIATSENKMQDAQANVEPEISADNYDVSDTEFIPDEEINKPIGETDGKQEQAYNEQTRETEGATTSGTEEAGDSTITERDRIGQAEAGIEEATDIGTIETTDESNVEAKRVKEQPLKESKPKKPETLSRKEYFRKKDEELYSKVAESLEPGVSISKTTEEILAEEKAQKEQELIDANAEVEAIYAGLEEELRLNEINKELADLNREIADMLNPEEAITKLTKVKQVKTEAVNNLKKISKAIADKTALLMKESANLTKDINKKESKLKQLELELSDALNILSEDEKAIVRETKSNVKIKEQISKNKDAGIKIVSKAKKAIIQAKDIKDKIKFLTNILGGKSISKEKINDINSRIRRLELEKISIKDGSDSSIYKSYKSYIDILDKLDKAESKQDIQELTYQSKTALIRYKNDVAIDKDIRARVIENVKIALEKETDEVLKSGIENTIKSLENKLPGYQDLVSNTTKYRRSTASGVVDVNLVNKKDVPAYIVAYLELDDNMKGQIKLKKGNNLVTRLRDGITEKLSADKNAVKEKVLNNFYNMKGQSYKARIDKEYPIGSESRKEFENTLYFDLSVIIDSKFIDSSLTLQKPISAIASGSDETMQDVINEELGMSEPEVKTDNELKKLDNPTITIEQGKIVARDSDGNIVDADKYNINIMALLFGIKEEKYYLRHQVEKIINGSAVMIDELNSKGEPKYKRDENGNKIEDPTRVQYNVNIPSYAEEIIKIETIKEIGNMYKVLMTDATEDDGKRFDAVWGIDGTNDYAIDLRQQVFDNYISKGFIPESVIVRSLGKKIYKALPLSFDRDTIERNTEDTISAQLGLYAIGALSRQQPEIDVVNEDGSHSVSKSGITRYASKQDVIDSNTEVKAFKELKEGKTMIALVETAWIPKKDKGGDNIADEDGNIMIEPKISPLRLMKLPLDSIGLAMKRMSETLEYTDESSIGNVASFEPITEVSDNIKNKITEKSNISKETILDYQSIEYKFTDNVKELYEMWKNPKTRNIAYKFANILDPNEDKLNIKQYKSRLAKNRNSRLELDSLMRFYEEAGTERGFYLKWDMIASGRYMIDSSISPQASKITRFLVSTKGTRTEIEFTNGKVSEEILGGIKRSMAQALDYGLDKDLDTYVIAKMEKDFLVNADGTVKFNKTENAKNIKILFEGFKKSIANDKYELSGYELSRLTRINEQGEGFHAVQAIRELARFSHEAELASGSESHKYDAHFVIEADGITSGMMITLAQIMTKDAINLFEKGGIYTKDAIEFWKNTAKALGLENELEVLKEHNEGKDKITHGLLNRIGKMLDVVDLSKDKKISKEEAQIEVDSNIEKLKNAGIDIERAKFKDFYNTVAGSVTKNIASIKADLIATRDNPKSKPAQIENAVLAIQLIDVVGDRISRNMAKDPVMVFIYGSSLGSIKNKILNGLIVETLQDIINDKDFVKKYGNNNDVLNILNVLGININIENKTVSVGARTKIEQVVGNKGNKSLEPVKVDIINGKKTVGLNMLKNIVIDGRMTGNLFFASFNTYGKAFEQAFAQNFNFINRYRDIIKALEVVRFQVFDTKFENKVQKLIDEKSYTDKDGVYFEYNPTNSELDEILRELTREGYGHAIKDINGGYHSFEKTEKSELDKRTSVRTIEKTPNGQFIKGGDNSVSNAVGIRKHVVNTGAAPVTSIHNQDGWQIRYATMKNGIQNVFDAEITGLMNHDEGTYTYNEGFSLANTMHSILQSQMVDMENILNSLTENEKAQMFGNFSDKKAQDILSVFEKMRNPEDTNKVYDIEGLSGKDRNRNNIDIVDELRVFRNNITSTSNDIIDSLSNPIEVAVGHLYATDTGKQYVGKLGGFKNQKLDVDMVFNVYYDIIANSIKRLDPDANIEKSMLIDKEMKANYVVENTIADNDKAKSIAIKKFENLLKDKSLKDEDKAEIRDIIEKLVNCKP